jgi:carboxymethylenebutenolidase
MPEMTIPTPAGESFNAYIAIPEVTPAPAVIVIQEIFGINKGIREKCDWLARKGFIACAPDLFWRIEPGIELSDQVPEELQRAFDLFGQFDVDAGIEDIKATRHVLKGHAQGNGKVGCLGYCLGGKLAYLTACRTDIDASVGYYGVGIEELLAEANNIQKPLMLHIAEEDGFVPKEAQEKIKSVLSENEKVHIHSYPGVDHAFTRVGGDNYEPKAAEMADSSSVEFLKSNLT